jgi:RNA polymerase sigma factor (sigma-70 family)
MSTQQKDAFFRVARGAALVQAHQVGLTEDNAEECAQSFVVKWLLKAFDPPPWTWSTGRCHAFVRRAARNHAINFQRDSRHSDREVWSSKLDLVGAIVTDHDAQPSVCLMKRQFWEQIRSGLDELEDPQRALFLRFHVDRTPVDELASASGRTSHAIRQSLRITRRRLRKLLCEHGHTESELGSYLSELHPGRIARARFRADKLESVEA